MGRPARQQPLPLVVGGWCGALTGGGPGWGWVEPVLCSTAPRQLSFPLTHELQEMRTMAGLGSCPLPHRPHPDLGWLGPRALS